MTTKDKILKSALKLFAKQGVDKTSTAQITKNVGIAEGTLFVHFKTKQDLIDNIYLDIKKKFFTGIGEHKNSKANVEKNIKNMTKYAVNYFLAHYDELMFMEVMERDPQFSPAAYSEVRKIYAPVVKTMKKWIEAGKLKKLDHDLISGTIWNLIIMITKFCKARKLKQVKNEYLDLVWDAVKAK